MPSGMQCWPRSIEPVVENPWSQPRSLYPANGIGRRKASALIGALALQETVGPLGPIEELVPAHQGGHCRQSPIRRKPMM